MAIRLNSRDLRRRLHRVVLWLAAVVFVVACIKPLRNTMLYPVWPSQWRDVGSYRILDMHLRDFFYPMDRLPYRGPCQDVRDRLHKLGILEQAKALNKTFRIFTQAEWDQYEARMRKRGHDAETMRKLRYFRPALTELEQRQLLTAMYVATATLEAFNVTYVACEGTLIGAVRHGGLIPWDDDGDLSFRVDQWPTAKRVLSCVPGYELQIYPDFLWKFYGSDSPLWKGEDVTRFPYVDIYPCAEDDEYFWPLIIWLKDIMMWPRRQVFPTHFAPFDNFRVRAPRDTAGILTRHFGSSLFESCQSRLFERRERKLMPMDERLRVDCRLLHDVYPFLNSKEIVVTDG